MREVKFRVREAHNSYLRQNGKFTSWKEIKTVYYTLDGLLAASLEDNWNCCPPEFLSKDQYTGRKDKNGKEIYEGDILRVFEPGCDSYLGVVCFKNSMFVVCDKNCGEGEWSNSLWRPAELEVLNTIHENPELLVEEK